MKRNYLGVIPLILLGWTAIAAQQASAPSWPRVKTAPDGSRVTIYQPQVDDWSFYIRLDYRLAVEIQEPGSAGAVPAALQMTAETNTDMSTRVVVVYNQKIVKASFPSADEASAERLTSLLTGIVPSGPLKMSVDDILAYVVPKQTPATGSASVPPEAPAAPAARTITAPPDPPVILYSQTPAVLVLFDGEPAFAPIEGTVVLFAINTNWDVFQEEGKGMTYLRNGDTWLQAPQPTGPWAPVAQVPKSFYAIPNEDNWAEVHQNLPGKPISKDKMPKVLVSVRPAELILLDGKPKTKGISKTQLLWISNTESDLFQCKTDKKYYYLVSGRWFRAAALDGPWALANDDLPADFAKIPKDHSKASVRASVPGTPEAQEALMLAQAPHKAEVKRSDLTVEVKYTGDPQFQTIEGTAVAYAVNTPNDVFRVENKYYCCSQAVWFVAPAATGPWAVADTIPASIYTIPPSCPKYNVTYVTIYESTPTTVTTGYTAGYMGAFILGACVVYGTGYHYPPYYYYPPHYHYPIYYPRPYTYGMAAAYNPYTGTFARGAVAYGPYGGRGYGAAYNPYTGTYARGAAAYGPYAGRGYAEAYNPYTGAWGQRAVAYGPGGQAGYAARGYNPSTGRGGSTYQRSNPYASWGESVVTKGDDWIHTGHYSDARGSAAGWETSEGGKGATVRTDNGRTTVAKDEDNNKYAAHDGNVYKKEGDSWQKYEDGNWESVEKPNSPAHTSAQSRQSQTGAQPRTNQAGTTSASGTTTQPRTSGIGGAQTSASPSARSTGSSDWSRTSSELQKDQQARANSTQRQKSYNSYKSGSRAGGSRSGGRRK